MCCTSTPYCRLCREHCVPAVAGTHSGKDAGQLLPSLVHEVLFFPSVLVQFVVCNSAGHTSDLEGSQVHKDAPALLYIFVRRIWHLSVVFEALSGNYLPSLSLPFGGPRAPICSTLLRFGNTWRRARHARDTTAPALIWLGLRPAFFCLSVLSRRKPPPPTHLPPRIQPLRKGKCGPGIHRAMFSP